jgi:hypothetical protein
MRCCARDEGRPFGTALRREVPNHRVLRWLKTVVVSDSGKGALDCVRWGSGRRCAARLPLGQVNPGQQVLDIQTKLISHAIRIAAFNTATALARDVRVHTGYARANHEAHTLVRQALTGSGDIDPSDVTLTVRLDPLPTQRAPTAIAQLCEHLTATRTRHPGTNLILRYEV